MDSVQTASPPEISLIVPARNEEASIADCLRSLTGQTGVAFEIIVVDDGSSDGTREIAESFPGVRVVSPPPLPRGWTGKNNAVWAGAQQAHGQWLLFTDADTVHLPGSLARAQAEARHYGADMLSYSPEQIAVTFWEMAVLPVVFAELARQYPPKNVSDPASPVAAANGQYILIRRDTYESVGGHRAIAGDLLEDVALARAVKSSGRKLRFRHANDAVRTRMYRNLAQLREGWTKNLALLFPRPRSLAFVCIGQFVGLFASLWLALQAIIGRVPEPWRLLGWGRWGLFLAAMVVVLLLSWSVVERLRRGNFPLRFFLPAVVGLPLFGYLLLRSKWVHAQGEVTWKGRDYGGQGRLEVLESSGGKTPVAVSAGRHR